MTKYVTIVLLRLVFTKYHVFSVLFTLAFKFRAKTVKFRASPFF